MTQRLFPTSDLEIGAWTTNGSDYFGQIDEAVDSSDGDTSRVQGTDESGLVVALSPGADPLSSTGHVFRVHARYTSAPTTEQLAVTLRQGGADLFALPFFTLTTSYATYEYTFDATVTDSITDYTALELHFYVKNFVSAPLRITAAELVIPDAPTGKGPILQRHPSQRALLRR